MIEAIIIVTAIVCGLTQVIFWIFIFQRAKGVQKYNHKSQPPVSIVIAARNEQENLTALLESLVIQDYPNFEIIIINDRSTDRTTDIVQLFQKEHPQVKLISVQELPKNSSPKKNAVTQGIKEATHEWLLFTDADCVPVSEQWIKEMVSTIGQNTEIVLGFSPYEKQEGLLNQFIQFETAQTMIQYNSLLQIGFPYMGVGRNLLYKKSLFNRVNGFKSHQSITSGDDDLFVSEAATKHNCRININPSARVFSKPETSLKSYFHQKTRHLSTGKYYKSRILILLGLFNFSHILLFSSFLLAILLGLWVPIILLTSKLFITGLALVRLRKTLSIDLNMRYLLFFDLSYFLYLSSTGVLGTLAKKSSWR